MGPSDKVWLRERSPRGGGMGIASLATNCDGYRTLWTCAESPRFKSSIRRPQSCKAIEGFLWSFSFRGASSRDLTKR